MLALSRLVNAGLALLAAPVIARSLGPDGRGVTASVLATIGMAPFLLAAGVPLAVRRRVADTGRVPRAVGSARGLASLALLPAGVLAGVVDVMVMQGQAPSVRIAAIASMMTAVMGVAWMSDVSVLIVQRRYARIAILSCGQQVVWFVAIATAWAVGRLDESVVVFAFGLGNVFVFGLGRLFVGGFRPQLRGSRSLLNEGVSYWAAQLAEISSHRLDQALMLPFIGAVAAGYYSIGVAVASLPLFIAGSVATASFPEMAGARGTAVKETIEQAVRSSAALAATVSICVAVLTPFVLPFAFGEMFRPVIGLTYICLVGALGAVLSATAASALVAQGHGPEVTRAQVAGVLIGVLALAVLGPMWGATGAAVASVVGYWSAALLSTHALRLRPRQMFPRPADLRIGLNVLFHTPRR